MNHINRQCLHFDFFIMINTELKVTGGSSPDGSAVMNPTSVHEDLGSVLGPTQWVKDLGWLWLWRRPAAAALIQCLTWKLP